MKKGLKKCLSIVLTIAMLVSVMSVSFIANAAEDTVTINGKTYTVGDTIEVKKEITINKWLLNGQVSIPYNSDVLKFVEEEPSKMFPVANGHSLVYFDTGSKINFNFLDVTNGIDFTQGGILYDLTFEVIAGSAEEVTIDDDLQVISTFPFAGDPQSEENQGKPVEYPFDSALENGTIPADKGTEGEIEIKGPEAETLTINGYEAAVGETVYISKKIQVNDNWLMNGQISVKYDPEYLQFAPVEDEKMFPNVSLNLMYNDVKEDGVSVGEIRITFTNPVVGYDFTTEKVLYDLPFTVIKGSDTAKNVTDEIEEMRSFNFAGDPADQTNPNYTMVNVVDESTGEIDAAKGTSDAEPVVADTPAVTDKIIVNDIEVVAGDEINYYLNIKDDNWFANGQYEITFNNTVLDLVVNDDSITYPVITAAGVSVVDNVVDNGDGTSTILFNFSTLQGVSFEELGKVFDFYFTVKEDAAPGNYTVDTKIVETYVFSTPGQPDGSSYDMTNVYNEETGELDVQESNLVTEIKDIDTSALEALIAEAKALAAEEGYTEESITALNDAIKAAEAVVADPQSQDQVDAEVKALQAAIDGLVVDTAELKALIAEAKELVAKEGYTEESIAALNAAIAASEAVVENPTVEDVKAQLEALKAAMDAVKPDTTALEAAIAAAEEKLADDKYSPTSKAALQAAVDAGKELLAKVETEFVSYEDVVAATDAINTAIDNLVEGVLLGDANDDGRVNIDDATYIQNFLVKLEDVINELAADVNKDGKLTVMDTTMIQVRLATGAEDEYVFPDEI
ncbi:MAG: dockerin type I domain-containing protein [Candidatus Limousia pullorum]